MEFAAYVGTYNDHQTRPCGLDKILEKQSVDHFAYWVEWEFPVGQQALDLLLNFVFACREKEG